MPATSTAQTYFTTDSEFDTWFSKPIKDGTYEGDESALAEWYDGVHWNTRVRIKSGGPQITDDLVAEGCSKDRALARREAEIIMLNKLRGIMKNANELGFFIGQFLRTDIPTVSG
jgi:hypothetical protein